jgi:hypothetical protein
MIIASVLLQLTAKPAQSQSRFWRVWRERMKAPHQQA